MVSSQTRIVVVSNRLPVTLHPERQPPHDVEQSSGGLASALRRVAETYDELLWIGWPGCFISSPADEEAWTRRLREESSTIKMTPVWLTQSEVEDFYNGYSNSSLWPLLHWNTPYARFKRSWGECYRRVNERFTDAILQVASPCDLIWIQDYHLFLVPQLLRSKRDHPLLLRELELRGEASRLPPSREVRPTIERPDFLPPTPVDDGAAASLPHGESRRPADLPELRKKYSNAALDVPGNEANEASKDEASFEDAEEGGSPVNLDPWRAFNPPDRLVSGSYEATREQHVGSFIAEVEQEIKLKIAFFLHTPFPSYEVICVLPEAREIVEGLLGADLVGFHTYSYLRHFRSCVMRLCGFTPEIDHIDHVGQRTRLGVFPIGANCNFLTEAMKNKAFEEHLKSYTEEFEGKSLVLSVERLDYSKGLPQKLDAIERYLEKAGKPAADESTAAAAGDEEDEMTGVLERLEKRFDERRGKARDKGFAARFGNIGRAGASFTQLLSKAFPPKEEKPLDHKKTVFLFIAVPSRQEVPEYRIIEEQVHRTISTINGRFATPTHQPIIYIHRGISMDELAALYARADVCLVTPLIDGMNLVAKEFVAAKDRSVQNVVPGCVVLSELAGAAQELFDAIVVNPYNADEVSNAIEAGLELVKGGRLDEDSRWEFTRKMRKYVLEHDVVRWAAELLGKLQEPMVGEIARSEAASPLLGDAVAEQFFQSRPGVKAIFLDYDGTLREFERRPEDAVPSEEAHDILRGLNARDDLQVFIVSGRNKEFLEAHFGQYRSFTLIAEHGYMVRGPKSEHRWVFFNPYTSTEWMSKVKPVMELFAQCTPGAWIQQKTSSIVWHYRECDDEYGLFKAKDLVHSLALSLGNLPCQIAQGHKIVEVSSLQVKKGLIVRSTLRERLHEFTSVLCVGDDHTDESMFLEAPEGAVTVKVGGGDTYARYRVRDPAGVRRFLRLVIDQRPRKRPPAVVNSSPSIEERLAQGASAQRTATVFMSLDVPAINAQGDDEEALEDPLLDLPECETPATPS